MFEGVVDKVREVETLGQYWGDFHDSEVVAESHNATFTGACTGSAVGLVVQGTLDKDGFGTYRGVTRPTAPLRICDILSTKTVCFTHSVSAEIQQQTCFPHFIVSGDVEPVSADQSYVQLHLLAGEVRIHLQ